MPIEVCHTGARLAWAMAALVQLGLVASCAPKHGWELTDARTCAPGDPPRICFDADPDQPLELRIGGTALVPGECARGPGGEGGGALRALLVDGREFENAKERPNRRWLRVPKGRTTVVQVADDDRVRVVERRRCDGTISAGPRA